MHILNKLADRNLIKPETFVLTGLQYLTIMGSVSYQVSSDISDLDLYGFTIPPKNMVFPHLAGDIIGFGRQKKNFEQFQQHNISYSDAFGGKGQTIDVAIYNIIKLFSLCMENNPNILDCICTPPNCVLYITKIGKLVKENRKMFFHKGAWYKFKGYAYSQLHKIKNKNSIGKRKEIVEEYGYDTKFAYHVVRLINQVEQILLEGDMDITRNSEQLKAIRKGEWKEEDIVNYFIEKEKYLEKLYVESKIPYGPDEDKIKQLLINCLEEYYGNLDNCVLNIDKSINCINDIKNVLNKYNF